MENGNVRSLMSTTVLLMWRIQQKLIGDWLLIIQYVIDVESESGLYLEMASLRSQQNYKNPFVGLDNGMNPYSV